MKKTRVKCANCGMIHDVCLDSPFKIECPKCKSNAYDIIEPGYQAPWKKE